MKILFVTGNYLPVKKGGIENYVHRLALILKENNFEIEVSALNIGDNEHFFYENIKVYNLKGSISSFENILKEGNFDIVHFHEYSSYGGIELPFFKIAKVYSKKVFFTFHLPYLTCYKNDFRFEDEVDCNIFNISERCAHCIFTTKMKDAGFSKNKMLLPFLETAFSILGKKKKLKLKVTNMHSVLLELIDLCDEIFLIADWFKKLLNSNGYNQDKLKLLPNSFNETSSFIKSETRLIKNKIVFVGRIQHQKGLHLLTNAMHDLKNSSIEVDVYGNIIDEKYFNNCIEKYPFNYKGIISRDELLSSLKNYDFLILPSVFTEMYPMVIQEAFSNSVPVIASAAKGNIDAIKDGADGFIFKYNDSENLAITIKKAYDKLFSGWKPSFALEGSKVDAIEETVSYYKI